MISSVNILKSFLNNPNQEIRVAAQWLMSKLENSSISTINDYLTKTEESGIAGSQLKILQHDFTFGSWRQYRLPTIKATIEDILQEMRRNIQ